MESIKLPCLLREKREYTSISAIFVYCTDSVYCWIRYRYASLIAARDNLSNKINFRKHIRIQINLNFYFTVKLLFLFCYNTGIDFESNNRNSYF